MKSFHQLLSGSPSTVTKAAGYAVFAEDMYNVAKQLESFESIKANDGATELAAIYAGELHLTTVDCPAHGIQAGRLVPLRMVIVGGMTISCCGLDIGQYAVFGAEIAQALKANPTFANKIAAWTVAT